MKLIEKLKQYFRNLIIQLLDYLKNNAYMELICEKIIEYYEKFKESELYNRLYTTYINLGEKERKIVNWSAIGFVGFVILMILLAALNHLSSYKDKITDAEKTLQIIQKVGANYKESELAIRSLRRRYKIDEEFKVASFVEEKASEIGVKKISSFDVANTQKKEYLKITRYLVKISKVHLRNVVDLLYQLENSNHPLFVSNLKMKRLFSNIKYFDIEFMISHKVFNEDKKNEK